MSRAAALVSASAAAAAWAAAVPALAQNNVTFSTVTNTAYASGDTNSCAIALNNLTTVGGHQFITYYDSARNLIIGRRDVGTSTWQLYNSGYTVSSTEIADDHNIIAMTIDSGGLMHLSWNMHNNPLNYAISNASVTGATLPSIAFTTQTAANAPTLFPSGGATTNSVTYPQFYAIPNSNNLLFTYRNGGAGGGSGNGDQYFNIYDTSAHAWTNQLVINGEATSVNAYLNRMAYTSTNDLMMSWTWRANSNWQTNSNILFAQSPDNAASWYQYGGTTQYTLPIIQSGSPSTSVAQVIKAIPQNSSFINQTSMTVDAADRPLIATWWTPGWNPGTSSGDPNRQYMLVYNDGAQWRTSQISNRTSDTSIDTSGGDVRDLGRPIVLVDNDRRVLVVSRSEDTAMGSYSNPSTVGNDIVVYYNTVASLDSATPAAWQSLTLDTLNMGSWEPTYDAALWKSQNKLSLFYEPTGLGQSSATLKILDWDEPAYFASLAGINYWKNAGGGNWDTPGNWTVAPPNASAAVANFGNGPVQPTGDSSIAISGTKIVGSITFDNPTYRYSLVSGSGGGALSLDNGAGTAAVIDVNSGSHIIAIAMTIGGAGVNIAAAAASTLTISDNMSGSGPLTKSDAGTLVLSGANSYSGTTTVSAGTLRIVGGAALSSNSNLVLNGGMLQSNVSITRTLGSSAGRIRLTGGSSGFAASDGTDVTVTINNGGQPISWGTSNFAPSTLVFNATGSTNDVNFTANLSLNGAARAIQVNGAEATLSGVISSSLGSLQVNGAGTLVLSNSANTYGGGTSINSSGQGPATVRATASNALGTGTITTGPQGNSTSARLELLGGAVTLPNAITFTGRNSATVAVENIGGTNTLSGRLTLSSGGANYWIQSDAGTFTLSGADPAASGVAITSSATGSRNVTLRGADDGIVSGAIQNGSATVSIAKADTGTWTLAGNNTFTGGVTVNAGKLVLASSLSSASSLTIAAGATTELAAGSGAVLKLPQMTVDGRLDVNDSKLVIGSGNLIGSWDGSAYTGLSGLIQSGRAGGMWTGNGIVTSQSAGDLTSIGIATASQVTPASATSTALWAGQTVSGSDTLIMYTYGGDATLDGKINVDDYGRIDFNVNLTGASGWFNGDFNYDGKINVDDYGIIDFNIGIQGAPFSTAAATSAGFSSVPEPTMGGAVALFSAVAVALAHRCRRR